LGRFLDLKDLDPYDVAERLTMGGLEVEGVERLKDSVKGCVVAEILEVNPHPNAPKLKVLKVTDGSTTYQVVCGAPNVREGLKVALALPGAELPNGVRVEAADIRGQKSEGMLLSEIELGLVEDTWGILELPEDAQLGVSIAPYVYMDDYVLEVSPTPNRGDCFGVLGVAREVAALYNRSLSLPEIELEEWDRPVEEFVDVSIEEPELCPRYTARYIEGVEVGESPLWMKVALKAFGMRPISNVVDITNYVLMEIGHPLHAFDYDTLKEHRIVVRRAREGEYIVTLDGEFRELDTDTLVIADAQRPVAIAGIMGGANSEVTRSTTKVLLESAYFSPSSIRRTSKRLGLSTEASKRFERGTDVEALVYAIDRTAELIQKLAGGKVAKGLYDNYPKKIAKPVVTLRTERTHFVLGERIEKGEIGRILTGLGFELKEIDEGFRVEVPYHRIHDVTREIDLIEEVARIWGYNRIPSLMPAEPIPKDKMESSYAFVESVRDLLSASGLFEVITYSFINPRYFELLGLEEERKRCVELLNPLSEEMAVMRTSLLFGLVEVALRNFRVREMDLALFETGKVFWKEGDGIKEALNLGFLLTGFVPRHWSERPRKYDFYDAKGIVEGLCRFLGAKARFVPSEKRFLHPGKSADVVLGERIVGYIGALHPDFLDRLDAPQELWVGELKLDELKEMKLEKSFSPLPRYPEVTRDLSFVVPKEIAFETIYNFITAQNIPYLKRVELIDVYEGKPIEEGKRSITLSFTFGAEDRTLQDAEVDEIFWKIAEKLEEEFPITIRTKRA